jgi:outer membrane protein OmpA-like peptidoglycan-associated protein
MPILNTQDQLLSSGAISVDKIKFENQIEARASKVTILKGQISDEKTGKFIEANIELDDIEKNINLAVFQSNSSTGKYLISLPSGKNYGITIRAKGYLFYSENFNLPKSTDYQEFTLDFALKKIEIGHTVVLRNIFFDSGKANLKPESVNELERLYNLLKENQQIKIEIISHTDNVGGVESNQKLSDYRSEEVIKYLIQKGISAARLKAIGYGEEKPIASNENAEGRQKNRRTEFKIISK